MKRLTKYPTSLPIPEKIRIFCQQTYGFDAQFKKVKIKGATGYWLTEYGHVLRFKGNNPTGYLISGSRAKARKKNRRRSWAIIQLYDGDGNRVKNISIAKLVYMTFADISFSKASKYTYYPVDGDNTNTHLDNIQPFECTFQGQVETYGDPTLKAGELSKRDLYNIRRSKATNRALGKKYNRAIATISRIRNYKTYKNE